MADSKITALTALTAADPVNDMFPVVDVSDTTMAASGTTKKISVNNILGASGTATLASATITGDLTVRTIGLTTTASAVGINTASPTANTLTLGASRYLLIGDSQSKFGDNGFINSGTADANTQIQYFGGKSLFFNEGIATRMTLNSTGLGVGVSPAGTGGCLQLKSGITFPATQVASSDANTLDDYEEGTWTPTVSATSGTLTTTTVNAASYTKIGRFVSVQVDISIVNIGTASGLLLFSLPTGLNQVTDANVGVLRELGATGSMGQIIYQSATQVAVALYNNGTLIVNGYRFRGTYTYTTAT